MGDSKKSTVDKMYRTLCSHFENLDLNNDEEIQMHELTHYWKDVQTELKLNEAEIAEIQDAFVWELDENENDILELEELKSGLRNGALKKVIRDFVQNYRENLPSKIAQAFTDLTLKED